MGLRAWESGRPELKPALPLSGCMILGNLINFSFVLSSIMEGHSLHVPQGKGMKSSEISKVHVIPSRRDPFHHLRREEARTFHRLQGDGFYCGGGRMDSSVGTKYSEL